MYMPSSTTATAVAFLPMHLSNGTSWVPCARDGVLYGAYADAWSCYFCGSNENLNLLHGRCMVTQEHTSSRPIL